MSKPALARTENILTAIAGVGAAISAMTAEVQGAATWVALGVCVAMTGTFAFFKTSLPAGVSGIHTRAFWISLLTILASVATAISEADIPGLPKGVTKIATTVSSLLIAFGYHVWRYTEKKST